ncbi:MAG: anthranilate synthase component I [Sphaerochaetaceae bacterium]|nr:anthranilate synthase component I [Sphaerochaetaceae bacterium]
MNFYPDLKQALSYNEEYNTIPISLSLPLGKKSPMEILNRLQKISKHCFLLESCEDSKVWGRYTYIGFNPSLEITQKDKKLCIKSGTEIKIESERPHPYIRRILDENKSPKVIGLPPFTGGLVGYFSYDFIAYSEPKLKLESVDEEDFNDIDLMLFDKIIAIDNLEKKLYLIMNVKRDSFESNYKKATLDLKSLSVLIAEESDDIEEEKGKLLSPLTPLFSKDQYCEMVKKAKNYIYEGDIFQVVLSNRLVAPFQGSLKSVYSYLRKTNPSPYMFYFVSDNIELTGASPETLVKLEETKLSTFPLAGTRKRGMTPEEDMQQEKELLEDPKERSEHNMLVDLSRNDIGKISKFGTVKVEEYMKIQKFSHVMHIGSTVTGEIKDGLDSLDAIDSILPAGTLSGAPKIRACEIINELENNRRGVYGGAIGYLSFNGGLDTCIAIRLAFKKNGNVYVRSGAGIVADSVPENEYVECINKAKAVINALEDK